MSTEVLPQTLLRELIVLPKTPWRIWWKERNGKGKGTWKTKEEMTREGKVEIQRKARMGGKGSGTFQVFPVGTFALRSKNTGERTVRVTTSVHNA